MLQLQIIGIRFAFNIDQIQASYLFLEGRKRPGTNWLFKTTNRGVLVNKLDNYICEIFFQM